MNLDQNLVVPFADVFLGFYQLGNELRPEHTNTRAFRARGFYQLGNELRPELTHKANNGNNRFYQLGNELRPELKKVNGDKSEDFIS